MKKITKLPKLLTHILYHKKKILTLLFTLTIFFTLGLVQIKFDYTPQRVFQSHSNEFQQLKQYTSIFGNDERTILLLLHGTPIFTKTNLLYLQRLQNHISHHPKMHARTFLNYLPSPNLNQPQQIQKATFEQTWMKRLYISEDADTTAVFVDLQLKNDTIDEIQPLLQEFQQILQQNPPPPPLKLSTTGIPYIRKQIVDNLQHDQMIFLPLCTTLFTLVLLYLFRQIYLVLIPLIAIFMGIVWTVGLMGWSGKSIDILNNVLPTLIFTIGISDAVHIIYRYLNELKQGKPQETALQLTIQHLAIACFFTSFTTAVGFASLYIAEISILKSLGIYAAIGVMFAYLIAILFIPTALACLPPPSPQALQKQTSSQYLLTLAHLTAKYPKPILASFLLLLAAFGIYGKNVVVDNYLLESFSNNDPVYQASRLVEQELAGIIPMAITFHWKNEQDFYQPQTFQKMKILAQTTKQLPGVRYVISPASLIEETNYQIQKKQIQIQQQLAQTTGIPLPPPPQPKREIPQNPQQLQKIIQYLQTYLPHSWRKFVSTEHQTAQLLVYGADVGAKKVLDALENVKKVIQETPWPGLSLQITGLGPVAAPGLQKLVKDLRDSLFLAFLIIFATITLVFRSLKLGLLSLPPNITPLIIAYGFLGMIGLELQITTIFVFPIALGLAVDDTIHFIVRYLEVSKHHSLTQNAICQTFQSAGKGIVFTTILLSIGFFSLLFSAFPITQRFGMMMEIIILSALLGDILLLPACLFLFPSNTQPKSHTPTN